MPDMSKPQIVEHKKYGITEVPPKVRSALQVLDAEIYRNTNWVGCQITIEGGAITIDVREPKRD